MACAIHLGSVVVILNVTPRSRSAVNINALVKGNENER